MPTNEGPTRAFFEKHGRYPDEPPNVAPPAPYCGRGVPYYNRDLGAQCSHPCRLDYGHAGECGIFRNERDPAERDDWQHDEGRWITDAR